MHALIDRNFIIYIKRDVLTKKLNGNSFYSYSCFEQLGQFGVNW